MSFLVPAAFLIGALVAIPVILLYMLRLRRREVLVSSNFLWQQILQDKEANTPWQRLRRNILLFLQLLILALLVTALARPFVVVPAITSDKTVLLLDASASMNATDGEGGRSRFDAARQQALDIVNQMGPDDILSVIRVGEIAEPLTPYTDDLQQLRAALNNAQPGFASGDWETALILAAAGAAGAEEFNVVIISDGGLGENIVLPANIPAPIYLPVGVSDENIGITALAARALPGQPPQLFAQVTNYGPAEAEISLVVKLDGVATFSRTDSVSGRSQLTLIAPVEQAFSTIEAEIVLRDNTINDYLAVDNIAYTVAGARGARRVLLISEENIFLEQVFSSLPEVQLLRGDLTRPTLPQQEFDLYVFNNWLPAELPDGDMLIINPPSSAALFTVGEEITTISGINVPRRDDPRMAFVDFGAVNLRAFKQLSGVEWGDTLIEADGGPLLVAGENDGRQVALMSFDIRDSDLPLQITWPVLVSNLLEWFTPADVVSAPQNLRVGETVIIRPPLETESIQITLPDGTIRQPQLEGEVLAFAGTSLPGLYRLDILRGGEVIQSEAFAVNLFGTGESSIAPIAEDAIRLGGTERPDDEEQRFSQREFWPWIALLALIVLVLEWRLYHRRLQIPTMMPTNPGRRAARRSGA